MKKVLFTLIFSLLFSFAFTSCTKDDDFNIEKKVSVLNCEYLDGVHDKLNQSDAIRIITTTGQVYAYYSHDLKCDSVFYELCSNPDWVESGAYYDEGVSLRIKDYTCGHYHAIYINNEGENTRLYIRCEENF